MQNNYTIGGLFRVESVSRLRVLAFDGSVIFERVLDVLLVIKLFFREQGVSGFVCISGGLETVKVSLALTHLPNGGAWGPLFFGIDRS